jgi:hypothetical protein
MTSQRAGTGRFVARFLLAFAVLTVLGAAGEVPRRYANALARAAAALSPLTNGWSLEERAAASPRERLWFRRGTEQMRLALSLEALALSLLPLLSLISATPLPGWRPRLVAAGLGILGLFALDLLVLLLYPVLVIDSAVTNIAGTFLGMLTFVGGPVILWFVLTYRWMRGVWRL